MSSSGNNLLA